MLSAGQEFVHFRIVRKLGEGGMGAVYLAEDRKLGRQVALKILLTEYFDSPERLERFTREAQMAARISHANVMAIYDLGSAGQPDTSEKLQYIVMEYIHGESLSEYLQSHGVDLPSTLRLAEKIAAGLAAAHKLHIVHRDIKADNIVINADGEPKILDFGLAKPLEPLQMEGGAATDTLSKELTRAGKIIGTVAYMSPEQARGETVDTRSDIFSFGILLYRMATGELPFDGGTQVSTLAKILEKRHESPRLKNHNVPPELERIIDKCLQKDPGDRYQDTRDLVVDLRTLRRQYDSGISESSVSGIAPVPAAKRTYQFRMGRNQFLLLLAAAALITVIVAALIENRGRPAGPTPTGVQAQENSLAILGFDNKTGDRELDWLQTGLPEILLTDLAQGQSLKLISRERILDCFADKNSRTHTHEEGVQAARSLGAVNVLSGSYYRMGEMIRIDARLEDAATGRIVLAEKVIGKDPFHLVDSLTAKIAASLNVKEIAAHDEGVSQFTSSSPEAYKLYLAGMEDFLDEFYDEAITKFNEALKIDSTFALPYMRIGMAYSFQGRQQQGAPYFSLAKKYEDKLPLREKALLDVYSDIWSKSEYDNAFIKMESFVQRYPDDKEGRAVYAILLNAFTSDTAKIYAQLDTALKLDPRDQLSLRFAASVQAQHGNYDRAIEYCRKLIEFYPQSPSAYGDLAVYLKQRGLHDEAVAQYRTMMGRFPDNSVPLYELSRLFVNKGEFDSSRAYLNRYRDQVKDDPLKLIDYYQGLADLDVWSGKFRNSLANRHRALEEAMRTRDSAFIRRAYWSLSRFSDRIGVGDSALYYAEKAYHWSPLLQRIDFPLVIVAMDHSNVDKARPIFKQELSTMRSRTPSEVWGLLDALQEIFDAMCRADTLDMLAGYDDLLRHISDKSQLAGNEREMAQIAVEIGQYSRARDILDKLLTAEDEFASAYNYLIDQYYLGRACEGLGDNARAVESYRTVLRYWGSADIETKEIRDMRARLARLTS